MWGRIDRRTATQPLLELLARRPELRDVGIAGYLAGEVLDNVPGDPEMDTAEVAKAIRFFMVVSRWVA
jgi:hypothetical protein